MHNLKVRKHFLFQKIAATKQIWCEGLVEWQKKDVMFICFYFIVAFQKKKTEILTNSVDCWTLCVGPGNPHYPVHRVLAFLPLPGWSSFTRHLLQFRTSAREWSGRVVTWWRSLGKFSSFQLAFTRYLRKDIMFTEYFTRLFVFYFVKKVTSSNISRPTCLHWWPLNTQFHTR